MSCTFQVALCSIDTIVLTVDGLWEYKLQWLIIIYISVRNNCAEEIKWCVANKNKWLSSRNRFVCFVDSLGSRIKGNEIKTFSCKDSTNRSFTAACFPQSSPNLFICARGLYMFLNRLFRQERLNRFLWFVAPLIKNGATLRKWYLFSCRFKNIWYIGISTNWVIRNLRRIQFAIQREQLYAEWGARLKNFHSSNLLWIIFLSLFEIVMFYETLSYRCNPRFYTCSLVRRPECF